MPPTHLPLYWQLPVLREAEGKFAEDSATEESDGNTHARTHSDHTPSLCCCPQAHNCTGSSARPGTPLSLEGWKSLFVGVERAAPATHPPVSPSSLGFNIPPGPGWKEKLEVVTQVQPLQSLTQQRREAQAAPGSAGRQTDVAEDCTQLAMADCRFLSRKQTPASSTSEFPHPSLSPWSKEKCPDPHAQVPHRDDTWRSLAGPGSKQGLQPQLQT